MNFVYTLFEKNAYGQVIGLRLLLALTFPTRTPAFRREKLNESVTF